MQSNRDFVTYIADTFRKATSESLVDQCLRLLEKSTIPWGLLDDSCIINRLLLFKTGAMTLDKNTILDLRGDLPRYGHGEWVAYAKIFDMLGIRRLSLSSCNLVEEKQHVAVSSIARWAEFINMLKHANIVYLSLPSPWSSRYSNLSIFKPTDIFCKEVNFQIRNTVTSNQNLMSPQQFKEHGSLTKTTARSLAKMYLANSDEIKELPIYIKDLIEENRNGDSEFNKIKMLEFK
jgi:hypothetical protein